jgi:hypothetical protein
MPRQDKTHDAPEQVEESWAERLDDFQATSDSKFGDINATLRRLDDRMLTNENHLLTTNEHLQASDKRNAANKISIDQQFTDITAMLGQLLQHQRHRSRSRSSRSSSSRSAHVDDHARPDVAPPMYDSAYYAISGYVVADTTKTKFLFLFLPSKEKIRDAIGAQYWWSVLSLKESSWGPPSSMLKMVAHQQKSLFYFSSVYFSFWFRKQLFELLRLFYFYIFILLVGQVIGRLAATIKPKGCAPM